MKLMVSLLCAIFMASEIAAQGFPPQFLSHQQQQTPLLVSGGTRRQLTPAQQTHILSDIQQHQRFATQNHLFNPSQNQKVFGQKIAHNIVIEPSLHSQLPTETTVLQMQQGQSPQFFVNQQVPQQQALQGRFRTPNNLRSNELHAQHHTQTNFIPNYNPQSGVVFPQQPLFERNPQQVFQRSVSNQQGDANHIFRPSQPFPVVPPGPLVQSSAEVNFNQPIQNVQTLQQNQIHHQQLPNPQQNVPFVQNHVAQNQVLPPVQNQQFPQFQNPQVHFAQPPPLNNAAPQYFNEQDPRYKDFVERQKIIQKHEHFVQRNHEKQQAKVRQLHQEFVQQQRRIKEQSIANSKHQQIPNNNFFPPPNRSRLVSPYELPTFERAVQNYQQNFPTQPSSTPYPEVTESVAAAASTTTRVKSSRSNVKGDISEDELERLLSTHREKLYTQLKQEEKGVKKTKVKPTKAIGREDLLRQLKLALADQPADLGGQNYTSMDLVLPDGQKVQVIRTTDPNLVKGATPLSADGTILAEQSEQKPLIEQAADPGLIPPGSDFEVIRQTNDGNLQAVDNLPNKKKVTFVYLEEQNDGSYKVQGVKSNGDKEAKTNGVEVDSIINRIKNGEIQLPPSNGGNGGNGNGNGNVRRNTVAPSTPAHSSTSYVSSTIYDSSSPPTQYTSNATPSPNFSFGSSVSPYSTLATESTEDQENLLTASPSSHYPTSTPRSLPSRSIYTTRTLSTTYSDNHISSTAQQQTISSASTASQTPTTNPPTDTSTSQSELINILKNNGLHAMAKYLRQSGLDSILNETGPYTVFAPSDKAFKNLLVQLGGPDRAEEKFKSNPRLLSGLLLHHVIPGFFEISSLQDEMTGVSLAGTQLRVNQYNMHDTEWNDVKVTTINGAMILPDKKDITIPQGIAHSVDRVMFPLPVGDILQTLQSDRERRFTNFLRALFSSGLSELLQNKDPQSGRTYTVFAPTDLAFSNHTQEEINVMVTDKAAAHKLVMRHVTPGTLFSSGMRFYQVRDSLQAGNAITLQKVNNGKIKVNESQMVSSNIPATNGVIHVIDSLL